MVECWMATVEESAYREIIETLRSIPHPSKRDLDAAKLQVVKKYRLERVPSNSELIRWLRPEERAGLLPLLKRKAVRTISGITVIAVMTKPSPCPKARPCVYCPGGPRYGTPQSYTGHEPAAMRGSQNEYDPYMQVRSRIRQLQAIGHKVDKCELVVMGGTFPAMEENYQVNFIKGCLDALTGKPSRNLEEAKKNAEEGPIYNTGITLETRPDWAKEEHVDRMLNLGATRVEIGVQNIYDDIYEKVNREHTVKDVIEATRILKDAGLKVCYHLMPGLPGSNLKRDLEAFKRIFTDPSFKPDMIKVYPCLVLKGTLLYEWWKMGEYQPYTTEEAAELLVELKRIVPPWVRIMRVQRDIPAHQIVAGVQMSNLRQIVQERMRELGIRCRCIRCREVGHRWIKDHIEPDPRNIELHVAMEEASEGEDYFISVEDEIEDILIAYLRLRFPSKAAHRPEITPTTALIRELRVFGPMTPVGERPGEGWQHRGYGRTLIEKAEELALQHGKRKLTVISALGTKRYYLRQGFHYDGPYVSKRLK